jgi:N-acetylglutamate synthase-like GNAT family acetyltransferase
MSKSFSPDDVTLRPATQSDAASIRQIIHQMGINPMGLDWQRFILAVDSSGNIVGCGQVKPHADSTQELASIAVLPAWRGRGIARRIIEQLLEQYPGRLYLTCRSELGVLYEKFEFQIIPEREMTSYFKRISRMVTLLLRLTHRSDRLLVMRRN